MTRLLPSNWMRLMTWFSMTVMTRRPPWFDRAHVLEQAGREQGLHALVDLQGIEALASDAGLK